MLISLKDYKPIRHQSTKTLLNAIINVNSSMSTKKHSTSFEFDWCAENRKHIHFPEAILSI